MEWLAGLWADLWGHPLYRGLLIAIGVEIVLVGALIVWLWIQSMRQAARDRALERFKEALEQPFFEALGDEQALRRWMQRAAEHPRVFVQDFLAEYLLQTRGQCHDLLVELYHEFGYAAEDHKQARGMRERKRLEAMRRLYVVATEADREVLLELADADHISRVLATQALARVGRPEDLIVMLAQMDVRTPMMEEPVYAVLDELSLDTLRYLFTRWQQFDSPRIRRILLVTAAQKGLGEVDAALQTAAASEEMEVRIGACVAAGSVPGRDTLQLLVDALDDPVWQVRANAAKSLGKRRETAAVEPLAEALKDRAFWVRQDAAVALRQVGPAGLARLQHVATHSDDRYAAEAAGQELQRHRLLLETRGAPA